MSHSFHTRTAGLSRQPRGSCVGCFCIRVAIPSITIFQGIVCRRSLHFGALDPRAYRRLRDFLLGGTCRLRPAAALGAPGVNEGFQRLIRPPGSTPDPYRLGQFSCLNGAPDVIQTASQNSCYVAVSEEKHLWRGNRLFRTIGVQTRHSLWLTFARRIWQTGPVPANCLLLAHLPWPCQAYTS